MSDFSSAIGRASTDADILAEADAVVAARIVSVGEAPGFWSGYLPALQRITVEVTEVRSGQELQVGDQVDVGVPIVAGSPRVALSPAGVPGLDPDRFSPGASIVGYLKHFDSGWASLTVDADADAARMQYGARRLGRGALASITNDPPRQGRHRTAASNASTGLPLTYSQQFVPNNEITFELAALGVDPDDPNEFHPPVDAEVQVVLVSASDPSNRPELGRGSVRVVNDQRGVLTFTGSIAEPIDPVCNYQVTVYNRIDPSASLTLRMWVWT